MNIDSLFPTNASYKNYAQHFFKYCFVSRYCFISPQYTAHKLRGFPSSCVAPITRTKSRDVFPLTLILVPDAHLNNTTDSHTHIAVSESVLEGANARMHTQIRLSKYIRTIIQQLNLYRIKKYYEQVSPSKCYSSATNTWTYFL
jgi:hypothetical protein